MGSSSGGSSSKKSTASKVATTIAGGTNWGSLARAGGKIYDSINSRVPSTTQAVKSSPVVSSTNGVYRTNNPGAQAEIDRLGREYNKAVAAGDMSRAAEMHRQANIIRDSQGGSGLYDSVTGREYGTQGNQSPRTTPDYSSAAAYPDWQPIDNSALYEQQAAERVARIRAAIQRQKTAAEGNISGINTQYGTAIQTAQNYGKELPGQFVQLSNQASNRGMVNAQRIRNAMANMGLGQSGASASQQLEQGIATDNAINANNQQLQNLTTDINTQVTGLQGEQAAKVAAIRQAIADAEAAGDEDSALALSNAQAQIVAEANQNAVGRNNWELNIAKLRQSAIDKASEDAWDRGGFNSWYEREKATRDLEQNYDLAKLGKQSEYDQALERIRSASRGSSSGGLTSYQQNQISQNKATNNALLQISSYGTKAQALAALNQHGADMIAQGVDIQAVMKAINDRWPY